MATVTISMSPQSEAAIARRAGDAARLRQGLDRALQQGLKEMAGSLQSKYARGGNWRSPRGGQAPLAVRTGALLRSIDGVLDGPGSGKVGSLAGDASRYAGVQLGDDDYTITPKNAKHLWMPVADNLNAAGVARLSAREAFEQKGPKGGTLLRIFESRNGNLVAGLEGGKVPGVKRKGFKLLFVLKDEVTVQGTGALALAVEEKLPRLQELLTSAVNQAAGGQA